jgi:hypothetical protein
MELDDLVLELGPRIGYSILKKKMPIIYVFVLLYMYPWAYPATINMPNTALNKN